MGLTPRLHLLLLVLAAVLVAAVLVAPYRSETHTRSDGVSVRVPPLSRLNHTSDLWDYLQLGRSLASGQGFTSLFTYPPFVPDSVNPPTGVGRGEAPRFPLYWRQPGFPILVAAAMVLTGREEPNAMLALQALAVILLPLAVYLLGRRVLSPGWSALAALWALLSPLALGVSEPLLSTTWFAVVFTVLVAVLLRGRNARAWLGTGVLLGLAALFRLETWILLPGWLVILWTVVPRARIRTTLLVLVPAVLLVLPWHLRLLDLTGSPFYNQGSLFFHDTPAFPAWSASRTLAVRDLDPLTFVLAHFPDVMRKTLLNLARYGRDLVLLPSPILAPFLWMAVLRPPSERRARGLVLGGVILVLVLVGTLAPMQYSPRFLACLVPLLAVGSAMTMSRLPRWRGMLAGVATGLGVVLLVVSLATRPETGTAPVAVEDLDELMASSLAEPLREGAVALADAPTIYAWIWEGPAVWAPVAEDVPEIRRLLPRSVALFTRAGGRGEGMDPDIVGDYVSRGGVASGDSRPLLVTWPEP